MLVDANDIKKCGHQAVHIAELNAAAFSLAHGNPVEDAAGGREIYANQTTTGHHDAVTTAGRSVKPIKGMGGIAQHFPFEVELDGRRAIQSKGAVAIWLKSEPQAEADSTRTEGLTTEGTSRDSTLWY